MEKIFFFSYIILRQLLYKVFRNKAPPKTQTLFAPMGRGLKTNSCTWTPKNQDPALRIHIYYTMKNVCFRNYTTDF